MAQPPACQEGVRVAAQPDSSGDAQRCICGTLHREGWLARLGARKQHVGQTCLPGLPGLPAWPARLPGLPACLQTFSLAGAVLHSAEQRLALCTTAESTAFQGEQGKEESSGSTLA